MEMRPPKIRLRYAGLIALAVQLSSLVTGLAFTTVITRELTVADFGLWQLISTVVSYAVFPNYIVSYWIPRYSARGIRTAKTGLALTLTLTPAGFIIYFIMTLPLSSFVQAAAFLFLLASIQVPLLYLMGVMKGVAQGMKPQAMSYSFLISEVAKVVLALTLVFKAQLGLIGAILAVAGSQAILLMILTLLIKEGLQGRFDWTLGKRWLKCLWLPYYNNFPGTIQTFDVVMVAVITGVTVHVAYFKAAYTVSSLILYATLLSNVLSVKLLSGGGKRDVEIILKYVLMFGIPMTAGALVVARPVLYLLNPEYVASVRVLNILALAALLQVATTVFDAVLLGTEKIDLEPQIKLKDITKSRLFLIPSLGYVKNICYLIALFIAMHFSVTLNLDPSTVAFWWAFAHLLTTIPFFIVKWQLAEKIMRLSIPISSIIKYSSASLVMMVIVQFAKGLMMYVPSIYTTLINVLMLVALGTAVYFTILYVIDRDFKELVFGVLEEVKKITYAALL